jgi:hypothetical protein
MPAGGIASFGWDAAVAIAREKRSATAINAHAPMSETRTVALIPAVGGVSPKILTRLSLNHVDPGEAAHDQVRKQHNHRWNEQREIDAVRGMIRMNGEPERRV